MLLLSISMSLSKVSSCSINPTVLPVVVVLSKVLLVVVVVGTDDEDVFFWRDEGDVFELFPPFLPNCLLIDRLAKSRFRPHPPRIDGLGAKGTEGTIRSSV